jgi:hypothetical protein
VQRDDVRVLKSSGDVNLAAEALHVHIGGEFGR